MSTIAPRIRAAGDIRRVLDIVGIDDFSDDAKPILWHHQCGAPIIACCAGSPALTVRVQGDEWNSNEFKRVLETDFPPFHAPSRVYQIQGFLDPMKSFAGTIEITGREWRRLNDWHDMTASIRCRIRSLIDHDTLGDPFGGTLIIRRRNSLDD